MIPPHAPSVNTEAVANPRTYQETTAPDNPWCVFVSAAAMERSASLSHQAFRVWMAIDLHARTDTYCFVGDDRIARMAGTKPRTIRLVLAELESAGYIRRVYTNGLAEPGKGTTAHRIGIILRKRLHPATPAADTPEAFDAAMAALGERSGTHGKILPRLMARSCQDSWQDPATEVSLSESALKEEKDVTERPLDRPGGEPGQEQACPPEAPQAPPRPPEPIPAPKFTAPHRMPPEGSVKHSADQLRPMIDRADTLDDAGRGELAGHIAVSLADDHSFVFWKRVVADLAGGKLSAHAVNRSIEAGMNTKHGNRAAVATDQIKRARANGGRMPAQPFPTNPRAATPPRTTPAPVYRVVRDDGLFADTDRAAIRARKAAEMAASPAPPPAPFQWRKRQVDDADREAAEIALSAMSDAERAELESRVLRQHPSLARIRGGPGWESNLISAIVKERLARAAVAMA